MTEIEPVYGAGTLLLIAAAAVALLLLLIIRFKLHAFVALVLVSLLTAVAAGIPVADVPAALLAGFSGTLGSVALLVGFGVMVGRLLESTGGAQVLADTLIARFGERHAPLALGVAALIFGLPIFFDAGLVVFLPIIFTVARRFGGGILRYGLPTAGAFAVMHAVVPPHPGPVAAAASMNGNIGLTLLIGLPIAVVAWIIGAYLVARFLSGRYVVDIPDAVFGPMNGGRNGDAGADANEGGTGGGTATATATKAPPRFATVLLLLLLPLVLISLNTVVDTLTKAGVVPEGAVWASTLLLLGQTPIALLITVLVALAVLAPGRFTAERANGMLDDALGPICSIILITGAGGMFGGVLRASGIGSALTDSLSGIGLPLILQAFVIATVLRVAQGSATVALTTTAGLISAQVDAEGIGDARIALLVFAVAAGATVLSHVNDSGFWLVSRFFGMDVKTTLKTWTVLETTLGLTVFLLAAALWPVLG
ncbi:GntP family permease [Promicromonospora thailandica]|uniref:Gluconate:H+ symporter, GntP family n=1 Tax=Promicromonospora thailandica TaxID=765201 RepID=A0A9X2G5S5_9MICO|nr:gluconate:H+ symporter [Promicromonospora thailandica]MCP2265857.1 gluconate:H+ symporter, GntP family [Promicromonospora thailandica]BFF21582.1 GntP family permease [Promicromonospora thailandica]